MITHLDAQVGALLDAVRESGLDRRTIVFFTSDNGATFDIGGAPTAFFRSNAPLRGTMIAPGTTSNHGSASWDMWATFAELAGAPPPRGGDGISILPTLLNRAGQREHDALYWEYHSAGGAQALRIGRWKGVRTRIASRPATAFELYDLDADPGETTDVAGAHPDVVRRISTLMRESHSPAALAEWNF